MPTKPSAINKYDPNVTNPQDMLNMIAAQIEAAKTVQSSQGNPVGASGDPAEIAAARMGKEQAIIDEQGEAIPETVAEDVKKLAVDQAPAPMSPEYISILSQMAAPTLNNELTARSQRGKPKSLFNK